MDAPFENNNGPCGPLFVTGDRVKLVAGRIGDETIGERTWLIIARVLAWCVTWQDAHRH